MNRGSDQYKQQFETLNNKLDKIIRLLTPTLPEEVVKTPKASVTKAEVKTPQTRKVSSKKK